MSPAPSAPVTVIYSVEESRNYISKFCGWEIGRTTFYRWRDCMGWVGEDYKVHTPLLVEALALFAQYRQKGASMSHAKRETINYLRGKENV